MFDSQLKPPAAAPAVNNLLLPSRCVAATIAAPTTAPQKLTPQGGSATGNPRNKCALKPGYSLMSWVRLCNSGTDLAGTAGRIVPVSMEELARHNKRDDAWMAIRDKVFNVTQYMDFHPGGVEELMRGVGRDATKLFDEVHAWVNYGQLLGKCYVGPLIHAAKASKTLPQAKLLAPPLPPVELVPRFDWLQQRSELTLYFYTRQFANPGLLLKQQSDASFELRVQLAQHWHVYDFELTAAVHWPPKSVRIAAETGKIEVVLCKQAPHAWPNYGAHKLSKLHAASAQEERYDFEVLQRADFNHDSFELRLQSVRQQVIMLLPVGYHLAIELQAGGETLQRSYTPVAQTYLPGCHATNNHNELDFLIKCYEHGQLSSQLKLLTTGDMVQLSLPRGNFELQRLAKHRHILLLAAGSGLTPMLSLLQPLLKRNTNRIERLHLLYFNKTEADIWLHEALQALQAGDARFTCQNYLSQAESAEGSRRIDKDVLAPLLQKPDQTTEEVFSYVAICGPNAFNAAALQLLNQLDFKSAERIHVFQG